MTSNLAAGLVLVVLWFLGSFDAICRFPPMAQWKGHGFGLSQTCACMSSVLPRSGYDVGNLRFLSLRQFAIECNNDEDEGRRMRMLPNAFLGGYC